MYVDGGKTLCVLKIPRYQPDNVIHRQVGMGIVPRPTVMSVIQSSPLAMGMVTTIRSRLSRTEEYYFQDLGRI